MADSRWTTGLAGFLVVVVLCGVTTAWEIQLRDDVTTPAAVVRLGDIADLPGIEPGLGDVLKQIIVAPGPTRSHRRVLTSSDVRKTLEQRGVDLQQCQLAGATRVVVSYGPARRPRGREPRVSRATRKHTSPRSRGPETVGATIAASRRRIVSDALRRFRSSYRCVPSVAGNCCGPTTLSCGTSRVWASRLPSSSDSRMSSAARLASR